MIDTPDYVTEKPAMAMNGFRVDVLSDVLSHVRLSGAIFLRGEYTAPWAFDSPQSHELIQFLAPEAQRLILFHIVREGRAWVSANGDHFDLEAGDLVVLPHADRHLMGSPGFKEAIPIVDLLPPQPWEDVPVCRYDGGGESTGVVCGYLKCEELLFNSFLQRLPPLFRVRPHSGAGIEWVRACVRYALDENAQRRPGSEAVNVRLPELLFVEALRLYAEQAAPDNPGWLTALNDQIVGRALAALHAEPARKWTVEQLVQRAATSRSVLDERFRKHLGRSPMQYLTEWRMQLAADLLRTTQLKLMAVAERSGYESEEAFSRAFRRHLGKSPSQWREAAARQL